MSAKEGGPPSPPSAAPQSAALGSEKGTSAVASGAPFPPLAAQPTASAAPSQGAHFKTRARAQTGVRVVAATGWLPSTVIVPSAAIATA
jgi:hypothetical protein